MQFPWKELGALVMVTLTYPDNFETDDKAVKRHLELLRKRMERAFGKKPRGIWALEFQERGAPHFHLFIGLPRGVDYEDFEWWGFNTWSEIVDFDGREFNPETYPDPEERELMREVVRSHAVRMHLRFTLSDPKFSVGATGQRVGEYLWRHSGKWGQKTVPQEYKRMGHFWGVWGGPGPAPEVELCCRRSIYEVRRCMRNYARSTARYRQSRFVGVQAGMTVIVGEAESLIVPLHKWAVMECDCPWYENDRFDAMALTGMAV